MPVTKSNATRSALIEFRDVRGMKWREIAAEPKFRKIPIRTLQKIYSGERDVPDKWRAQLGEPEVAPAPVCPRCNVVHLGRCKNKPTKQRKRYPIYTCWLWDWAIDEGMDVC